MDVHRILAQTETPSHIQNDALFPGDSTRAQLMHKGVFSFERFVKGIRKNRHHRFRSSIGNSPVNRSSLVRKSNCPDGKMYHSRAKSLRRRISKHGSPQKLKEALNISEKITIKLPPISLTRSNQKVNIKEIMRQGEIEEKQARSQYFLHRRQTLRAARKAEKAGRSMTIDKTGQPSAFSQEPTQYTAKVFDFLSAETFRIKQQQRSFVN